MNSFPRYHGLDLARSIFMILGVYYHSALTFSVNNDWRISYHDTNLTFNYIVGIIFDFRMYAFYILSGFFFCLVYEKYGLRKTIQTRIFRLGIPLIFVGVTVNTYSNHHSPDWRFSSQLSHYILNGEWLGQLWFIGNLLVYNFVSLIFVKPLLKSKTITKDFISRSVILIVAASTSSVVLSFFGLKLFSGILVYISFRDLYIHFPFYLLGMYFYAHKNLFFHLLKPKISGLYFALILILFFTLKHLHILDQAPILTESLLMIYSTCFSLFIMALLNLCNTPSILLTKTVNSSYTIYLIHEAIILFLFPIIIYLNLNCAYSYIILTTAVLLLSFVCHEYIISKYRILELLFNGLYKSSSSTRFQPLSQSS